MRERLLRNLPKSWPCHRRADIPVRSKPRKATRPGQFSSHSARRTLLRTGMSAHRHGVSAKRRLSKIREAHGRGQDQGSAARLSSGSWPSSQRGCFSHSPASPHLALAAILELFAVPVVSARPVPPHPCPLPQGEGDPLPASQQGRSTRVLRRTDCLSPSPQGRA
jgi:hypothetical protein